MNSAEGAPSPNGNLSTATLKIPYSPPFDWESLLDFLRIRATPGVELVDNGSFIRTASIGGYVGKLTIANDAAGNRLIVRFDAALSPHSRVIRQRVSHLFDLAVNVHQIGKSLARTSELRSVVRRYPGLRVPGSWDPFELSVRAIVGQQVTVKAATTLMGRITERAGVPIDGYWKLFPSPEQLASADLGRIGAPSNRVETVTRLAQAIVNGQVSFSDVDSEMLCEQLTRIKGIGRWTAGYIAMRTQRSGDSYPYGDLVLRKALSKDGRLISAAQVDLAFEKWRPWRAYAALYLWRRGPIESR